MWYFDILLSCRLAEKVLELWFGLAECLGTETLAEFNPLQAEDEISCLTLSASAKFHLTLRKTLFPENFYSPVFTVKRFMNI